MTIWVCQEGEWDYWEPVVAYRTKAQAERWMNRDKPHRQIFEVKLKPKTV